jgi:hypothetical protein
VTVTRARTYGWGGECRVRGIDRGGWPIVRDRTEIFILVSDVVGTEVPHMRLEGMQARGGPTACQVPSFIADMPRHAIDWRAPIPTSSGPAALCVWPMSTRPRRRKSTVASRPMRDPLPGPDDPPTGGPVASTFRAEGGEPRPRGSPLHAPQWYETVPRFHSTAAAAML